MAIGTGKENCFYFWGFFFFLASAEILECLRSQKLSSLWHSTYSQPFQFRFNVSITLGPHLKPKHDDMMEEQTN